MDDRLARLIEREPEIAYWYHLVQFDNYVVRFETFRQFAEKHQHNFVKACDAEILNVSNN
jgi:hypothetical protein